MLTLPQLLTAARSLLARYGAVPYLSTRDGRAWQCLAHDAETCAHADSLPTMIDATPEGAVVGFIELVDEASLDERRELLRSLADAYPAGVTVAAPELAAEVA